MTDNLKTWFLQREDQDERPVYKQLYGEMCSMIKPELLPTLPRFSFIMFKPDAYMRGIIPDILAYSNQQGIYHSLFKVQKLSSEIIDRLYMFVKPKYISSWWIMEKAYDAAPCVPMLLITDQNSSNHLSSKVRELLGPTTPFLGSEHQIRYRFRGTHRIFNILHGTDDPATAVRESRVFFTWDEISNALHQAHELSHGHKPALENHESIRKKLTPPNPHDINYPRARLRLKLNVLECVRGRLNILTKDSLFKDKSDGGIGSKVHQLMEDLTSLFTTEGRILNDEYQLRVEKNMLAPVLELQRISCSLGKQLAANVLTRLAQDVQDYSQIQQKSAVLYDLIDAFSICSAMSNDVEFRKLGFNELSRAAVRMGIQHDPLDWLVLHAGLSVLDTEFADYVGKYKSVYLEQKD